MNRRDFVKGTVLSSAALALAVETCGQGQSKSAQIRGKIALQGTPPPEIPVDLSNFPEVTAAYPNLKLTTRHYVVAEDGGLANVFVYVKEGLEGRTFPPSTDIPLLDQTKGNFSPYVMGVRTGQTFHVKNSEPYQDIPHAVPKKNKEFQVAQPFKGMVSAQVFDTPEVLIRVKCDIHPWEFSFIGVVEHPFFAVTEADGTYRLPSGLPAGKYVIEAVHPKAGAQTLEVEVAEGGIKTADFKFQVRQPKPAKP